MKTKKRMSYAAAKQLVAFAERNAPSRYCLHRDMLRISDMLNEEGVHLQYKVGHEIVTVYIHPDEPTTVNWAGCDRTPAEAMIAVEMYRDASNFAAAFEATRLALLASN